VSETDIYDSAFLPLGISLVDQDNMKAVGDFSGWSCSCLLHCSVTGGDREGIGR